jgi:tetratricopeptide (TPR) repeat protein
MKLEKVGKYKILAKIGQGAMGEVYKAQDTVLNRFVAIKTITGALGSDDQFRQRFHREAQSAASLNHRNIVTVFEFAEDQGMVYMAMELLEGKDLKELIARGALKRFEDKLSVIEQMCDGLAFAHAKGVVHRDLKPANIHVLANGTVKIMDFGLARLGVSEITRTGTVMGTPNYMSPEQVRGEKVDSRSDIFSVGAVMYEVLAGHKPFEAESMHSVLFQVLDQNPEPIRNRTPEIPAPIADVVDRALAKDPAQRFKGAGEMRVALRNARRLMAAEPAAATGPAPADATFSDEDPTLARSAATYIGTDAGAWSTQGATALDLSPASRSQTPRTARPHPTMVGSGPRAAGWPGWVYAVVVVGFLVIAGAGLFVWLRARQGPPAPPAEVAREQERILRETLIAGQVELAQGQLDNKNYGEAITQADRILAADQGNSAARAIRDQAQGKLDELQGAAKEARAAFKQGDLDVASQKLSQVMAIDPSHPVVGELSASLDRQFRGQVEEARVAARKARGDAEKARGQSYEGFASSDRGFAEGERLLQGNQFVQATQKFLEARDGFARARRAAEVAEAAALKAAAAPSAAPSQAARSVPSMPPSLSPVPPVTVLPSIAPPTSSPILSTPATPTTPTSPTASSSEAAIQKVLADYARAIETKDLALFRAVKPGLSGDEEKGLREFFKNSGSYKVGLTIESVKVDGGQATVVVSRNDTAGGNDMKGYRQTFRLAQRPGGWVIQAIGIGK